jgi:hypothetical protein
MNYSNSLFKAKFRKDEKYSELEKSANELIKIHFNELMKKYRVYYIEVKTYYEVESSLGVVTRETVKTMKNIFNVRERTKNSWSIIFVREWHLLS